MAGVGQDSKNCTVGMHPDFPQFYTAKEDIAFLNVQNHLEKMYDNPTSHTHTRHIHKAKKHQHEQAHLIVVRSTISNQLNVTPISIDCTPPAPFPPSWQCGWPA